MSAGWMLVTVVLALLTVGGGVLLIRGRGPDPAVQERFDRYCRLT